MNRTRFHYTENVDTVFCINNFKSKAIIVNSKNIYRKRSFKFIEYKISREGEKY